MNWSELGVYDDFVLEQHLKVLGCRAPYQKLRKHFPICSSREKIQKAGLDIAVYRKSNYFPPCEAMSNMQYDYSEMDYKGNGTWFQFTLDYPDRVKVIRQSKEITIHTLVGNVGGYIALFLVKYFLWKYI